MTKYGCKDCDHANKPSCFKTCEVYKQLVAQNKAKNEYLRKANADLYGIESTHADLARKKRRK